MISSIESDENTGNIEVCLVVFTKGAPMSFKADTLLKKATTFERLALYGDRKVFLAALAQDPQETVSAYDAIDTAVKQLNSALQQFINTSSEVQTGLPGRTRGLPAAMGGPAGVIRQAAQSGVNAGNLAQVVQAARQLGMLRNLGNMGRDAVNAWLQTVSPAALAVNDAAAKVPAAQSLPEQGDTLQVPETEIKGKLPNRVSVDPQTLKAIQNFINQEMVVQRQLATPITPNGVWNTETANMLQQWGKANNLPINNMQTLLDMAKIRTMGNQVTNTLQPGPGSNLEQTTT